MGKLKFTTVQIEKALDSQINNPWQDYADNQYTSLSKQSVTGGQEYDFNNNGLGYSDSNFPTYITKLWDTTTYKIDVSQEMDSPVYVARVQLTFEPTAAASGVMEFHLYIDDTVPILIQTIRVAYKATESRMEALFAFYIGTEFKSKGAYITYTPSTSGYVWDRGILVYRT